MHREALAWAALRTFKTFPEHQDVFRTREICRAQKTTINFQLASIIIGVTLHCEAERRGPSRILDPNQPVTFDQWFAVWPNTENPDPIGLSEYEKEME